MGEIDIAVLVERLLLYARGRPLSAALVVDFLEAHFAPAERLAPAAALLDLYRELRPDINWSPLEALTAARN